MKKIFIAIPAYDGKMAVATTMSLLANFQTLQNAGHNVEVKSEEGNCYITAARNSLVRMFLETDCTDLIFVDTDLWFEDNALLKLMQWDRDIVCGVYPKKKEEAEFAARPFINNDTGKLVVDSLNGLISLDAGPTGLMRIQRYVLEKMVKSYPNLEYGTDSGELVYDFFECVRKDKVWWGEDYAFCHKARDVGFTIWCEPNIDFIHIGTKHFKGNFKSFTKEKGVV